MSKPFNLDFKSQIPIFQQIVDELERQILIGELKPGEFILSVRELALLTTVNPNTVAKAYLQLQSLGLVEPVRGKGLVVKKVTEKTALLRRDDIIVEKIQELLALGQSLKMSLDEIIELVRKHGRKK